MKGFFYLWKLGLKKSEYKNRLDSYKHSVVKQKKQHQTHTTLRHLVVVGTLLSVGIHHPKLHDMEQPNDDGFQKISKDNTNGIRFVEKQ